MRSPAPLLFLVLTAAPAPAQSGRQALTAGAERYLLADYRGAVPLLGRGLDPRAGPPDDLWLRGVERLADVLLVLGQDSLAATWLRWAVRLAPELDVDAEIVPPAVVRAAVAARAFVDATPHDRFVARTEFEWPAAFRAGAAGTVRLAPATIPITARIGPDQFLRGGESRRLAPGSYYVVVSAPGYLPTRLTVEVLPGVTTVVAVSLLPETAGLLYVAARPWATVFVDGQRIGYTGVAAHRVTPGRHVLRLQQKGGATTTDTSIVVEDRQPVRLSWVIRRDTTGDTRLDAALTALDAGEAEDGVLMLRQWLSADPTLGSEGARATALARLAEATWSLGAGDSARAYLRELVRVDPFYTPPADVFNPELGALYERVRRETPAIRIRAPRDTVMTPLRDSLPVQVAVGRPGEVRLLLRLSSPRPRDSLLGTLAVDSVAIAKIPLTGPDSTVWAPGSYAIEAEVVGSGGGASDLLQLTVERLPVDTTPHESSIPHTAYRPETKKARPSARSILEGMGLGALALAVPAAVNDRGLSGRSIPSAAWLIGGSVALADMTLRRPRVPIPENTRYNVSLRAQWEAQNRAIAAENAGRLRLAPFRIRALRQP